MHNINGYWWSYLLLVDIATIYAVLVNLAQIACIRNSEGNSAAVPEQSHMEEEC